jgi:excisionase family DNA binding protein
MEANAPLERLLTAKEVGEVCGLCSQSIYNAVKAGDLRAVRFGRAVRVPESALREWIEQRAQGRSREAA